MWHIYTFEYHYQCWNLIYQTTVYKSTLKHNTQLKYFFKLLTYCETKVLQMITIKVETLIISASLIHAVFFSPFKTVVICYVALI